MTILERHEELLKAIEEAERMASALIVKRCAVRTIVSGLRDIKVLLKDRIGEYKQPPQAY